MAGFCPDGYLPTRVAIVRAAECWFPDEVARLEAASAPDLQKTPDNSVDALARALSQMRIPDVLQLEFQVIVNQTVRRLHDFMHLGKLKTYYFEYDGRHSVSREYWSTAEADGSIESGTYWPLGKAVRWYEQRLNYALVFKQSELDALLNERPAENAELPRAKMPDLVAALRSLDHLPNRKKQREVLRRLPEFEQYHLTDDIFREAEKQVPRKPGRKPARPKE